MSAGINFPTDVLREMKINLNCLLMFIKAEFSDDLDFENIRKHILTNLEDFSRQFLFCED